MCSFSVTKSCPTHYDPMDWLQHIRSPCPPLSPRVCLNLCPLSWCCYPTISSSATLFSFCLQSFSASGSFLMSELFPSGGQSTRASASASIFQWGFRADFLEDWLIWSPYCTRLSQESSPAPQFKIKIIIGYAKEMVWT